tara:strand:- start:7236 stop:9704 length:2469 start_codon:yes stop_codon:yes gene_type:complete
MSKKPSIKNSWKKLIELSGADFRREWIVYLTFKAFIFEIKQSSFTSFSDIDEILCSLPHFEECIKVVNNKMHQVTLTQAQSLLESILIVVTFGENKLGDLYQVLKSDCAKDAFRSTLQSSSKEKLEERKLLVATQYFTDDYISNYLLTKNDFLSDSNTIVLDPACGAGHILISALKLKFSGAKSVDLDYLYDCILGYDIDPIMVELSKLAIFLFLVKHCELPDIAKININYYEDSVFGKFKHTINIDKRCLWITNPPYAGKRDLSPAIKDFLKFNYPESKGDLCIGFMLNLLENAKPNDSIMLIMQKSWLTLSSYSKLRELVIERKLLRECVDLGSNSFSAISGEKANIALITLNKSRNTDIASFYDLSKLSYKEKKSNLENLALPNHKEISIRNFLHIKNCPFIYNIPESFLDLLKNTSSYGQFATPMQGTSTGDHKNFIDFIWNRKNDKDWVLVSKGGAFSRWFGLNSYCVKWGENGELVRMNSGSALRNIDKFKSTQLVYSDTGKLGLNVRLKYDNQIFVASGPGILIKNGCEYAHLAFLNSKFSSYFIRKINDKLTISAGYIASLPCREKVIKSMHLSALGKRATDVSKFISQYCITEISYSFEKFLIGEHALISPENFIKDYLAHYAELKQIENEIDREVYQLFSLNYAEIQTIEGDFKSRDKKEKRSYLDNIEFNRLLGYDLRFAPKSLTKKGFGTDNLFEYLTYEFDTDSSYPNNHRLNKVDITYLYEIFIHHFILHISGFSNINEFNIDICIKELQSNIKEVVPEEEFHDAIGKPIEDWINIRFPVVHNQVFKDSPVVVINKNRLVELRRSNNV